MSRRSGTKSSTRNAVCVMAPGLGIDVQLARQVPVIAASVKARLRRAPAEPLVVEHDAPVLDAVGPRDDERHGQARQPCLRASRTSAVRCTVFAGTVDAALGIEIAIDRPGRIAALDAAIGQIEGARGEIEERVVRRAPFCATSIAGCRPPSPRVRPGIEPGVAARIGLGRREHLVVARDEPHLDAGRPASPSASERTKA